MHSWRYANNRNAPALRVISCLVEDLAESDSEGGRHAIHGGVRPQQGQSGLPPVAARVPTQSALHRRCRRHACGRGHRHRRRREGLSCSSSLQRMVARVRGRRVHALPSEQQPFPPPKILSVQLVNTISSPGALTAQNKNTGRNRKMARFENCCCVEPPIPAAARLLQQLLQLQFVSTVPTVFFWREIVGAKKLLQIFTTRKKISAKKERGCKISE